MKAPINRIIPFSNVDGPGNRMAIFFQTCPFRCLYCHNPETMEACINCGDCVATCPAGALRMVNGKVVWNQDICVNCDTCLKTCTHHATPKIRMMSVEDVLAEIRKAKPFIKGITVSGGECMNHADFLQALFTEVKKLGLTCFIDSNGFYEFEKYPKLMEVCDAVMLDVKAYNNDFHKQLTTKSNETVLRNLDWLLEHDKMYEVRTVLMNNCPYNKDTVEHAAKIISDRCRYKLIKYRPFGVRQEGLEALGTTILSDEELEACVEVAKKYMDHVVIV